MGAEPRYGLLVEDIKILATQQGVDWWLTFRTRFEPVGRVVPIKDTATPVGDWAWVKCGDPDTGEDSRTDAELLRDLMISDGVPKNAVHVKREPAEYTYATFKRSRTTHTTPRSPQSKDGTR